MHNKQGRYNMVTAPNKQYGDYKDQKNIHK